MKKVPAFVWLLPYSVFGLLLALVGKTRLHNSKYTDWPVLAATQGGLCNWYLTKGACYFTGKSTGARGFAIGFCVFVRDGLEEVPGLVVHESRHVTQSLWFGPLWLFAYLTASLIAVLQGKNYYVDNWFEVDARSSGNTATAENVTK